MEIWDVYARRTPSDEPARVGSVKAPDAEMAILLAREAFFRHAEAPEGFVGRDGTLHPIPLPTEPAIDKSYRRADGYVGVGAKHARAREDLAKRGLVIDAPRPPRT